MIPSIAEKGNIYLVNIGLKHFLTQDKEYTDLGLYVSQLIIVNKYDENNFPYFKVMLRLTREHYMMIQENIIDSRFVLNIEFMRMLTPKKVDGKLPYEKEYIVCKAIDIANYTPPAEEDGGIGNATSNNWHLELDLFYEEHLKINEDQFAYNFMNTNVETVITNLIVGHYKPKIPVIFTAIDNARQYRAIMIPSMNFIRSLYYIQKYYGIYKTGLKHYSTLTNSFITPPEQIMSRSLSPEKVYFEIVDNNQSEVTVTSLPLVIYNNNYIFRVSANNVTHKTKVIESAAISGSNIKASGTTVANHDVTQEGLGAGGIKIPNLDKTRKLHNKTSNGFAMSEMLRNINEASEIVNIRIENIPFTILDLDTEVIIRYYTKQAGGMGGSYRIKTKIEQAYKNHGENYCMSITDLVLVRLS
jgi:hypothetical protein